LLKKRNNERVSKRRHYFGQRCQFATSDRGGINFTKDWANWLLARMGYVKRKATTKAKVSPELFDNVKTQFLSDIWTIVAM